MSSFRLTSVSFSWKRQFSPVKLCKDLHKDRCEQLPLPPLQPGRLTEIPDQCCFTGAILFRRSIRGASGSIEMIKSRSSLKR